MDVLRKFSGLALDDTDGDEASVTMNAVAILGVPEEQIGHQARALASVAAAPAPNLFTLFTETWHPALAVLSSNDFLGAWRLAEYLVLDSPDCSNRLPSRCINALLEVAAQREVRMCICKTHTNSPRFKWCR
jgi:hypothetical protein